MSDSPPSFDDVFDRLARSPFRRRFRLSPRDLAYIRGKGLDAIRSHAGDFVRTRLAPARPPNDGKQTPMRGHPVFTAQHATACCCRGCLAKWHRIPEGVPLDESDQRYIVFLLMAWISRQLPEASSPGGTTSPLPPSASQAPRPRQPALPGLAP